MPVPPENPVTTLLLFVTELATILAIATPSSPYRKFNFIPIALLVIYQFQFTEIQAGVPLHQSAVAFRLLLLLLTTFDLVWVTDAPRELRLIGDKTDLTTASALSRFLWAFKLHYSPRGIGWSNEKDTPNPPPPSQKTRLGFIVSRLGIIARNLLIHDVNLTLMRRSPLFAKVPPVWDTSISSIQDLLWRIHFGPGVMLLTWISFGNQIAIISIIWVALGLSDYKLWPTAFGSIRDAYTIRRFWGKMWHQYFRRAFITPANVLANALGLPRTGLFQRYFKLFIVFSFSAIIHQIPDGVPVGGWKVPTSYCFFLIPVPTIMLEDAVFALAKRMGIRESKFTMCLGYIYVIGWLSLFVPVWVRTFADGGLWKYRMDFSLVDGLLTGNWHPYSIDYL